MTRTTVGSDAQESPDPTGLREGPRGNQGRLPRLAPAEMLSAEPIHRVNALTTLVGGLIGRHHAAITLDAAENNAHLSAR